MDDKIRVEPAPVARTRAERRRLERGDTLLEEVAGFVGCKFCKSTKGTYQRMGNRFFCATKNCRGNR